MTAVCQAGSGPLARRFASAAVEKRLPPQRVVAVRLAMTRAGKAIVDAEQCARVGHFSEVVGRKVGLCGLWVDETDCNEPTVMLEESSPEAVRAPRPPVVISRADEARNYSTSMN